MAKRLIKHGLMPADHPYLQQGASLIGVRKSTSSTSDTGATMDGANECLDESLRLLFEKERAERQSMASATPPFPVPPTRPWTPQEAEAHGQKMVEALRAGLAKKGIK